MKEERRRHDRVVIADDRLLVCQGVNRPLAGKVSVLGAGGMYIRTNDAYPIGTELDLRIQTDQETLEMPCMVRDVTPGGMGVEFTWLRAATEQRIQKLMARVKAD